MTNRRVPILLSMVVTLSLLFGGWFLYQKVQVENPIETKIGQMTSAKLNEIKVDKTHINVKLTVTKPDEFPEEYNELQQEIAKMVPDKEVDIAVTNQDGDLKDVWNNGLFAFTEAVELHQYSKIPAMLAEWKQVNKLDRAASHMDDENIYVFLQRGDQQFYTVIPRQQSVDSEVILNG
ncbi:hypothetical protein [Brevibacillus dissolubilis]|uniref:hypothetical protein n=1 Tax=Brevibacillus dissolubilis TaxID=1844116 RepID=UPI001116CA36|nr:hypothetical protein [Brevibacillus dissolubilis]